MYRFVEIKMSKNPVQSVDNSKTNKNDLNNMHNALCQSMGLKSFTRSYIDTFWCLESMVPLDSRKTKLLKTKTVDFFYQQQTVFNKLFQKKPK